MNNINIGEAIYMSAIIIAVVISKNYWLLFFNILPILTWQGISSKVIDKTNKLIWKEKELGIKKLELEIKHFTFSEDSE